MFFFRQVQRERDELLQKQTQLILDVQQKSGLKELLLERKLAALTETLEKKEAQLYAALSASNVDQTAGSAAIKLEVRFYIHVSIRVQQFKEPNSQPPAS